MRHQVQGTACVDAKMSILKKNWLKKCGFLAENRLKKCGDDVDKAVYFI
jgi:hypothetical protein